MKFSLVDQRTQTPLHKLGAGERDQPTQGSRLVELSCYFTESTDRNGSPIPIR